MNNTSEYEVGYTEPSDDNVITPELEEIARNNSLAVEQMLREMKAR